MSDKPPVYTEENTEIVTGQSLEIVVRLPGTGVVTNFFANARDFRTGSRGYGFYGKIRINDKKYQVVMNIIEVGSKPASSTSSTSVKTRPEHNTWRF